MRIVFIASEVVPFAKTGGLADVCRALPLELASMGHEVSVIMPEYKCVGKRFPFSSRATVDEMGRGVRVYFIKSREFFSRAHLYAESSGDYPDNLERFSFFCREALALLKDMGKPVDIIHCHDWQTGLVPVLLKKVFGNDPFFSRTRTVFTIHNLAYQGIFSGEEYPKLEIDPGLFNKHELEFYGKVNLMKAGIVFSDHCTTVSPEYAKEIRAQEWGCGLEGVVQEKKDRFSGILNGLDYEAWDPAYDEFIDPPYSPGDQLAKKIHKEKLQKLFGLPAMSDIPVFGFVGRLCYQKGLDLIESAFEDLMCRPIQMTFLGVGEDKYQKLLKKLSKKCSQQFSGLVKYDEDVSHQVFAGADFFLMPSVYEPCGLTQMIALRYGTIPVVSGVGGLLDTIIDPLTSKSRANGFGFSSYSVSGLLEAIDRAMGAYHQKEKFAALIAHGMGCRWTWRASAEKYIEVYQGCLF